MNCCSEAASPLPALVAQLLSASAAQAATEGSSISLAAGSSLTTSSTFASSQVLAAPSRQVWKGPCFAHWIPAAWAVPALPTTREAAHTNRLAGTAAAHRYALRVIRTSL